MPQQSSPFAQQPYPSSLPRASSTGDYFTHSRPTQYPIGTESAPMRRGPQTPPFTAHNHFQPSPSYRPQQDASPLLTSDAIGERQFVTSGVAGQSIYDTSSEIYTEMELSHDNIDLNILQHPTSGQRQTAWGTPNQRSGNDFQHWTSIRTGSGDDYRPQMPYGSHTTEFKQAYIVPSVRIHLV